MGAYRVALGLAGSLLIGFGCFRLVTYLDSSDLVALVLWLLVAVVIHDYVVAPMTVGAGVVLTRVPARARRYLQGALLASALVTVVAVPLIGREGTQPPAKALLLRDYAGNLALILGMVAAIALVLYLVRVARARSSADG
jgi:hypothetical protein